MTVASASSLKRCPGCGETKQLAEFARNRSRSDGHSARCVICRRAEDRERYARNRAEIRIRNREAVRKWRQAHPERQRELDKKWRNENLDQVRKKNRQWELANPERKRLIARNYYERNKERLRLRKSEQWAKRSGWIGRSTPETNAHIRELLSHPCTYCGAKEQIEIDHVVPLSRGGAHEPENLAPACGPCNRSKGAKLVSEWRKSD